MKRRKFVITSGVISSSFIGLSNISRPALGERITFNSVPNLQENWTNPEINLLIDTFSIDTTSIDTDDILYVNTNAGLNQSNLSTADTQTFDLTGVSGRKDISGSFSPVDLTNSDSVTVDSDLQRGDVLELYIQFEIGCGDVVYYTDTKKLTISVINPDEVLEDFENGDIGVSYASQWSNQSQINITENSLSDNYSIVTDKRTNSHISIDYKPEKIEFLWKGELLGTDSYGSGTNRLSIKNSNDNPIAYLKANIDDSPDGDDQYVYQVEINNNNVDLREGNVYKVMFDFDWTAGTFDFYADDNLLLSDMSIISDFSAPFMFEFEIESKNGNDNIMTIDNLKIIPI